MPPHRLLALPLALVLVLAAAGPALAADVTVPDYRFAPAELRIAVNEQVTWTFTHAEDRHTTTAAGGQADSWSSGLKGAGESFSRTFTKPGRFQYFCSPHPFMRGVIEVGEDKARDTIAGFKSKRSGSTVTVSFRLNEPAKVTYRLKGPSRRTVRRGRLSAGRHSFKVRRLEEGSYGGTLTAVDDFDKKDTAKRSFAVR
jgi:plastocyanin